MAQQALAQPDSNRVRELIQDLVGTEYLLQEVLGVGVDAVLDPETGTAILLPRAQAELRLLLQQLPAIAWTVDWDLRYTSLQGTGLAALGQQPGKLVGRNLADGSPAGPPDQELLAAHRRALDGEPADLVLHQAGRVWQVHVEALRDAAGQVTGAVGVALDTTARAQAEAEVRRMRDELEEIVQLRTRQLLEANEELEVAGEELRVQNDDLLAARRELEAERQRYRDLFDLAPDGYLVTDHAGIIQEANRAAAARLGVPAGFLVGQPLATYVDPRNRAGWYAHLAALHAGERDAGPWEMVLQPRGREPFYASVTVAATASADGRPPASLRWLLRDVSARKQAEAERDAEHARLQAILSSAPEGISVVDARGRVLFANRAAEQLYARPVPFGQGFESHAALLLCYPDGEPYEPRDLPLTRSALDGETLRDVEMDIVWPDGQRRRLLVSSAPVLGPDGSLDGAVGVFQDITWRKEAEREREQLLAQAQEARRRSEDHAALLDAVISSIADGIVLYDAQGNVTRANAAAGALLGLSPADWNLPLAERIQKSAPLDANGQPLDPQASPVARALRGETVYGDMLGRLSSGPGTAGLCWLLVSAAPVYDGGGELRGAVVIFSDVTELRHARDELEKRVAERTLDLRNTLEALQVSEERFRELAENIDELFWLVEAGTQRVLYISPAYEKLWGRPAREVYERPERVLESIHPEDRDRVVAAWRLNAREFNQEFRILRPDGSVRWLRAQTFPVETGDGAVRRIAGVLADVTEQRHAQAAVVQMERVLVAARLAATLAHEINNPLQSAVGCLDLAREALDCGQDPGPFLAVMDRALDRARAVVVQLRTLHRQPETEEKRLADLRALLKQQLPLTEKRSRSGGIEVTVNLDEDLPRLMLMPESMSQVFQHLVLNALDAMPEGGQLLVEGRRTSEPDGVWIRFVDTGIGLPPEMWDHLFEPFQSTKSEGLGLGLFISQNVVQQHGGHITIEPRPGGGTVVGVWLPAV